jgi:glycyl-tRNA synthetase
MGWGELWGIADRTDYDLSTHMNHSGADLRYLDPVTNEKYIPYVIEPSVGLDRLLLAVLVDSYNKEIVNDEERIVLKLNPNLAPYKVSILPLNKKIHSEEALNIYQKLSQYFACSYDDSGSIGKRYRRSDAVGTPFAITIDDETLNNNTVTIRDRDTMKQDVIKVSEIKDYLDKIIK